MRCYLTFSPLDRPMKLVSSIRKNPLGSLSRISAGLIQESQFLICDTEGGEKLTQFCALTTANEIDSPSLCLNLFNTDSHRFKLKNFKHKNALQFSTEMPLIGMLTAINQFCTETSDKSAILIAHSAISAESIHLTNALLETYRAFRLQTTGNDHSSIVGYIDTLLLFRRLYPRLSCYKQSSLVKHFFGTNYRAHNALDDSLMLYCLWHKFIWPQVRENMEVLEQASISNLHCVDRMIEKQSRLGANPLNRPLGKDYILTKEKCSEIDKVTINVFKTENILGRLYPKISETIFK